MIKGIAAAAGVMVALTLAPVSAHAADVTSSCDPATRPASVTRVEHHPTAGPLTIKTWVTNQDSLCLPFRSEWIVTNRRVREWKRYSLDSGGRACQMFARHQDGSVGWSAWKHVPWADATNC